MVLFNELWAEEFQNAEIAVSGSETFGGTTAAQLNKDRYGSANSLIISSRDDNQLNVYKDHNDIFAILQPNGSVIIKPEDGIYFDTLRLENLGSDVVAANKITIRMARAQQVQ